MNGLRIPAATGAAVNIRWGRPTLAAALLLLCCAAPASAAKDPGMLAKIPLGPLGYPAQVPARMMSGNAMFTLNYVDSSHLLFTFTRHELMRRIPGDPPDDQDRNVAAVLLEIPSGKVVAETTWRLHDYGQYLWDLGGGRFLLRKQNALTMFAPLAHAAEPFAEQPVLQLGKEKIIADIGLTFDRGVMVLEISQKPKPPDPERRLSESEQSPPVAVQFIRLLPGKSAGDPVRFRLDAAVLRPVPTEFSLTSTGFMQVAREGPERWGFDYHQFNGQVLQLAGLESSCAPFPVFVSGSEFVTFGCRGSDDKTSLTGFSLNGDISWEMTFAEPQGYSTLSTAPEAGRFAISRGLAGGFVSPVTPAQILEQEVRVLQSYDGKQLLRVNCSPVQASGQNFAIAPDGLSLAVMQGAIVVYALPALNESDRKALAAAQAITPKLSLDAKVDLSGRPPELPHQPASPTPTPPLAPAGAPSLPAPATLSTAGDASAAKQPGSAVQNQDPAAAPPEVPRKPPSLLGP